MDLWFDGITPEKTYTIETYIKNASQWIILPLNFFPADTFLGTSRDNSALTFSPYVKRKKDKKKEFGRGIHGNSSQKFSSH